MKRSAVVAFGADVKGGRLCVVAILAWDDSRRPWNIVQRTPFSLHMPTSATTTWGKMVPQETGKTELTVPVVEETATIEKRKKVTGTVRLRTDVHEHEVVVDEPLLIEEVAVERVPVDRWVDGPVPVRQEGDTTIIPVLEEVVVVEKRLKLIEEVRLTKRHSTRHFPQRLTVRRQEAVIDRHAPPSEHEVGLGVKAPGPSRQD